MEGIEDYEEQTSQDGIDRRTELITCTECGASINEKIGLKTQFGNYCEPHGKEILAKARKKYAM